MARSASLLLVTSLELFRWEAWRFIENIRKLTNENYQDPVLETCIFRELFGLAQGRSVVP